MMRHCKNPVARQWRKTTAPLNNPPYRVNPAAQVRATAASLWRSSSKLGFTRHQGGSAKSTNQSEVIL